MNRDKICFEDFCNDLVRKLNDIKDMKGSSETIILKSVLKSNDQEKRAITVEGKDLKVSPIVYLEELYKNYDGKGMDSLAAWLYDELQTGKRALTDSDVFDKLTHDGVKENLFLKLINRHMNEKYLENKVYREYLDLAIIYLVQVSVDDNNGQVVITKDLAEQLDFSEEELFNLALTNSPKLHPAQDISLSDAIGISGEELSGGDELFRVITNKEKIYGASVLLYPGFIKELYERHGNRYVIPSSLHEVLLVDYNADPENYLQMVKEVNGTVVNQEDYLSDSVYEITADGLSLVVSAA